MMLKHVGRNRLIALCLSTMFFLSLCVPALAAVPERPENKYVLDSADVLTGETEKHIISKNEKLFRDTGAEIVVAALDFVGGKGMDEYSADLFDSWGVGSSQRNNGLLLVLAVGENKFYAISGYGIADYFNGAKLSSLLSTYLEEDFDAGEYDSGVRKFFDAALSEMESYYQAYGDEYNEDESPFTQGGGVYDYGSYDSDGYENGGSLSGFGRAFSTIVSVVIRIVAAIVILIVFLAVIRSLTGGGGRGSGTGGGGGGFWTGLFLGNMMRNRRTYWHVPPPRGFGGPRPGPRPPMGGFGGFGGSPGGFTRGGRAGGGAGRSGGGFTRGGGTRGTGAGRR